MCQTTGDPTGPSRPDRLVALVGDIACANHHAFTRLYRTLAPPVAADLRVALPDQASAAAITTGQSAASGPPDATRAMHDRRYELTLAALLDHPCADGGRDRRRNEYTDRVGTP